jgi:hypothetical protein
MDEVTKDTTTTHSGLNTDGVDTRQRNCTGLLRMAERELVALFASVTELFGSEQARLTSEDWVEEVESLDTVEGLTNRDWRQISISALVRLARRLNASSMSIDSVASSNLKR